MVDLMVRIARTALWAPLTVIVVHYVAGGWLGHEPYVDPVAHFLGGVAIAFFFWQAGAHARVYLGEPSSLALGLLAFGLASVAAVCWEFLEFLADRYFQARMQPSLANTLRDLFLGMSGAGVYVVTNGLLSFRRARSKPAA